MAKLSQLLTLERMLDAYDMMHTNDAWIIEKHGVCTGELLDDIIAKLVRQLNSKTTLSCRNVLVANVRERHSRLRPKRQSPHRHRPR